MRRDTAAHSVSLLPYLEGDCWFTGEYPETTRNFPGKSGKPFREITLGNRPGKSGFPLMRKRRRKLGGSRMANRSGKPGFTWMENRTLYWTSEQTRPEVRQNWPSNKPSQQLSHCTKRWKVLLYIPKLYKGVDKCDTLDNRVCPRLCGVILGWKMNKGHRSRQLMVVGRALFTFPYFRASLRTANCPAWDMEGKKVLPFEGGVHI